MGKHTILGAIVGDVIGSVYELNNVDTYDFLLLHPDATYTDDTVLTIANADAILHKKDFALTLKIYALNDLKRGYGGKFLKWVNSDNLNPYYSFGNGSAIRVSPVAFAYESLSEVLDVAKKTAEVTHNHPEGIKGAQATAAAIFLARKGFSKNYIKDYIEKKFSYDLSFKIEEVRQNYLFDETCQGSVPHAIVAFLESNDFVSAIRKAIYLGGDSDTIACIAGAIACAFYKEIPKEIVEFVVSRLPKNYLDIILEFDDRFAEN